MGLKWVFCKIPGALLDTANEPRIAPNGADQKLNLPGTRLCDWNQQKRCDLVVIWDEHEEHRQIFKNSGGSNISPTYNPVK